MVTPIDKFGNAVSAVRKELIEVNYRQVRLYGEDSQMTIDGYSASGDVVADAISLPIPPSGVTRVVLDYVTDAGNAGQLTAVYTRAGAGNITGTDPTTAGGISVTTNNTEFGLVVSVATDAAVVYASLYYVADSQAKPIYNQGNPTYD